LQDFRALLYIQAHGVNGLPILPDLLLPAMHNM
jgi:hypothetical protein